MIKLIIKIFILSTVINTLGTIRATPPLQGLHNWSDIIILAKIIKVNDINDSILNKYSYLKYYVLDSVNILMCQEKYLPKKIKILLPDHEVTGKNAIRKSLSNIAINKFYVIFLDKAISNYDSLDNYNNCYKVVTGISGIFDVEKKHGINYMKISKKRLLAKKSRFDIEENPSDITLYSLEELNKKIIEWKLNFEKPRVKDFRKLVNIMKSKKISSDVKNNYSRKYHLKYKKKKIKSEK